MPVVLARVVASVEDLRRGRKRCEIQCRFGGKKKEIEKKETTVDAIMQLLVQPWTYAHAGNLNVVHAGAKDVASKVRGELDALELRLFMKVDHLNPFETVLDVLLAEDVILAAHFADADKVVHEPAEDVARRVRHEHAPFEDGLEVG